MKKLFFFFYVSPDMETNIAHNVHKIMLKHYLHVFDELNFIVSVDDTDKRAYDTARAVKWLSDICGDRKYNMRVVDNVKMRESRIILEDIMPMIEDGIDGRIFVAHSKGITDVNMPFRSTESVLRWVISMYYYSLEYIEEMDDKLEDYGFYGSLLTEFKTTMNADYVIEDSHNTFYIGNFYWVNPANLHGKLIKETFDKLNTSRFLYENFPLCFGREELSSHDNAVTPCHVADLYHLDTSGWLPYLGHYGDPEKVFELQNSVLDSVNNGKEV